MTCNLNVPVTTTDKMDIPNTQRETHDMQPQCPLSLPQTRWIYHTHRGKHMTCNLNVPVTTTDKMDIAHTQRETHDMQPQCPGHYHRQDGYTTHTQRETHDMQPQCPGHYHRQDGYSTHTEGNTWHATSMSLVTTTDKMDIPHTEGNT